MSFLSAQDIKLDEVFKRLLLGDRPFPPPFFLASLCSCSSHGGSPTSTDREPSTEHHPALPRLPREPRGRCQIIRIQQSDARAHQLFPDGITRAYGPGRRVPVPCTDALAAREVDLVLQDLELRVVEVRAVDAADVAGERGRGDGGDLGCEIGLRGREQREVRVEEVVPVGQRGDLGKRRVARADHGDGAVGDDGFVGCIVGGEEAGLAQRVECLDDVGERAGAVGLDVDEQVQRLARVGVEDAVVRRPRDED